MMMGRQVPIEATDLDVRVVTLVRHAWLSADTIAKIIPNADVAFLDRLYFHGYLDARGSFYKADQLGIIFVESLNNEN